MTKTHDKHQATIDRMYITTRSVCILVTEEGFSDDAAIALAQRCERWPELPTDGEGERVV